MSAIDLVAAVVASGVVCAVVSLTVESVTWRRRQRRETAAKLAGQPAPSVDLDPVDAHMATAIRDDAAGVVAAALAPDSIEAQAAALIRQAEAHLRRAAGDVTDTPIVPGDPS